MHHFVSQWMSESLLPAAFLRFSPSFSLHRETAVSCCLWKEAPLFHKNKAQTLDNRSIRFCVRVRNYWVTGWGAEGGLLMKELYMKIIVGQIIILILIYYVGSVWWLVLLKLVRLILKARGHSSWDLWRWSCKDKVNIPNYITFFFFFSVFTCPKLTSVSQGSCQTVAMQMQRF